MDCPLCGALDCDCHTENPVRWLYEYATAISEIPTLSMSLEEWQRIKKEE